MKATRPSWRPMRWFLLPATAGTVLAADNTWTTKLRFDLDRPMEWLMTYYSTEQPTTELAPAQSSLAPASSGSEQGVGRWLNSYLYASPACGWTLGGASAAT